MSGEETIADGPLSPVDIHHLCRALGLALSVLSQHVDIGSAVWTSFVSFEPLVRTADVEDMGAGQASETNRRKHTLAVKNPLIELEEHIYKSNIICISIACLLPDEGRSARAQR